MKMNADRYANASFLLGGAACTLILVNDLLFRSAPFEEPLVPGFRFLSGLALPVLCFWAGTLLRRKWPSVRWWIQGLVAAFALFCLCMYVSPGRVYPGWWSFLYVAVIGAGFLFPPRSLARAGRNPGWEYLLLLAGAVYCYTGVSVSLNRVQNPGVWSLASEDMFRLVKGLLAVTEPLLLLLFVVYFAGLFSFSRAGQWLGGRKWFRWIVAVPCLFSFVLAASNLITAGFRWDIILARLLQLLVQPVTVWLVVIIRNAVKNRPARKNAFNPDNA